MPELNLAQEILFPSPSFLGIIIIPFLNKKDRAFFLPLTLVSTDNNILFMIKM